MQAAGASNDDSPAPRPPTGSSPRFVRFLLAVAREEPNEKLWGVAQDLVRAGSEGMVCHVVMRSTTSPANETDGDPANEEESGIARELRTRLGELLGKDARGVTIRILHGDPGERICEYAEYAHCDLIVLGSRGKSSLGRLVKGSVSKFVVANSRRSVLVIGV
jgi:nucleotide-binding universal stress UspA family protein